jgi:integrase
MTGLRKGEIASLTKASFKLGGKTPTLTVEAKSSKHRKKDVLPVYAELAKLLQDWLKGLDSGDLLFPKLAGRKA